MFNMRGFSANNSLFVDGVRDDGLIARDVFNLEQIEVFSGPTGSDVGRTNAAGYINLTTKTPQPATALQAGTLSYGAGDAGARDGRRQPAAAAGRARHVPRQRRGPRQRAVAGRRRRRAATTSRARASRSRRRSPSASARRRGRASSAQIMRQDNLADYGLPAAASPVGPLAADGGPRGDARRSGDLLRQSRLRLRQGRARTTSLLRLEHDFGADRHAPQPDALQHDRRARAVITSSQCRRLQPGDQSRHAQPPGERAATTTSSRTRPA